MSLESRIGPQGRDDDLTRALRGLYAAPADDAYWASLTRRVMAGIAHEAADARWQPLARFARVGMIAAVAALIIAELALVRSRETDMAIAYDAVVETPQSAPIQLATDRAPGSVRDVTLRYVISP